MKRYRVEFSPEARQHTRAIEEWWVLKRPGAPTLFLDELEAALAKLEQSPHVAPDIVANGLLVDYNRHGSAAWAYYIDRVPARWRSDPLVVFEVEATRVIDVPIPLRRDQTTRS